MWHGLVLGREFFDALVRYDEQITQQVAAAGCPHCGGRLHRSDYERKPRGGTLAAAGEAFSRRFSLCCGREGCRKRVTPPSLRFLGRRVYLGAAVIVACAAALTVGLTAALRAALASRRRRCGGGTAGGGRASSPARCSWRCAGS